MRAESERANSERANSERANSERANSERANSERANSERANSERANSENRKAQGSLQALLFTFHTNFPSNRTSLSCFSYSEVYWSASPFCLNSKIRESCFAGACESYPLRQRLLLKDGMKENIFNPLLN